MTSHSILTLALALTLLAAPLRAAEPPRREGYETVQQAYDAYKTAEETRDSKAWFLLLAPQYRDGLLLTKVMNIAQSKDAGLLKICDQYGVDWRPYYGKSTAALNEMSKKDPQLVERFGATIANKTEFFAAATDYSRSKRAPRPSTKFLGVKSLVEEGSSATVVAITEDTITTQQLDKQGRVVQEVPFPYQGYSTIKFQKVDGRWFVASL